MGIIEVSFPEPDGEEEMNLNKAHNTATNIVSKNKRSDVGHTPMS